MRRRMLVWLWQIDDTKMDDGKKVSMNLKKKQS
jgi:hypothetical protein